MSPGLVAAALITKRTQFDDKRKLLLSENQCSKALIFGAHLMIFLSTDLSVLKGFCDVRKTDRVAMRVWRLGTLENLATFWLSMELGMKLMVKRMPGGPSITTTSVLSVSTAGRVSVPGEISIICASGQLTWGHEVHDNQEARPPAHHVLRRHPEPIHNHAACRCITPPPPVSRQQSSVHDL
ncbi:hypothetical protein JB92DRAFT_2834713 [Gautieria morchelliformis]|nr:hypothetical protein JB92DRAFT_2834713 [Gautieria morchelliformis]